MKNSGYITPNQKEPAQPKTGGVNDGQLRAIAYSIDRLRSLLHQRHISCVSINMVYFTTKYTTPQSTFIAKA